jgi:DNA-directed RNA polymerase subunit RPC12/RpoP
VKAMKKKYKCGICQTEFDTAEELWFHQQLGHL